MPKGLMFWTDYLALKTQLQRQLTYRPVALCQLPPKMSFESQEIRTHLNITGRKTYILYNSGSNLKDCDFFEQKMLEAGKSRNGKFSG